MNASLTVKQVSSIAELSRDAWNLLVDDDYPFLRYEFLHALETSGAVTPETGWTPCHLGLWQAETLVGVMPCYLKTHSSGEYVFDWAWADAWERAGGRYYPKALTAIPFTPVPGPRLSLAPHIPIDSAMRVVAASWEKSGLSSWHLLFAEEAEVDAWQRARPNLISRDGVQFQWQDAGFGDFDGFLAAMTSRRRKEIRRERRRVAEQGIRLERLRGDEIDRQALEHFYRCYQITYLERGRQGYLNFAFFQRLLESMAESLVLVRAYLDRQPIAAALCLQGSRTLYGRYWGSEVMADCLHFEACYYQGIEHCLSNGLTCFDPGTQGEHKLTRGFAPRKLRSLHYIADFRLEEGVARFCEEERRHLEAYRRQARQALPFRDDQRFRDKP